MNPWLLLAALGGVLVLTGIVAVFKVKTSGDHEIEFAGVKIKSSAPGVFIVALGAVLAFLGVQHGTMKAGSHVTAVVLQTDAGQGSATYNVRCPMSVGLVGQISLSGDPGDVSYRLDRQDGLDGPIAKGTVQTIAFRSAGTERVRLTVPVTIPEGTVTFLGRLVTIDPTTAASDQVAISVTCNPNFPQGPPGPPPSIGAPPP